ncbi:MAG: NfeD family protein [bacterium]|nr:NfeD family protein [Gammaproteobacteria bacterium]HIL97443.1 NfeD family protein [Pseudomonadales bacterium]
MNFLLNPTYWIIAGILLAIAEMIIPGGIVVFMGVGCLVVALALWSGLVTTWVNVMTLFFVSTLVLIFMLRSFAMKFAGGDTSESNTIEILDEVGDQVEVVETIGPGNHAGRILHRGTQWAAMSDGSEIKPGETAKIIARENISYIVEKSG